MKKIVLTGGGTAGHVTPNIALMPELKNRGYDISYIGSYEGMEKGMAQGMEKGIEKGIAQGIERGIAQGMEKGIERGTNRERLQNIRSLMETTGWPAEQVMTAMKIPAADQPKYLKLLSLPQ